MNNAIIVLKHFLEKLLAMNSQIQVPIHGESRETRPIKRHHTARYYAHRVKESLTTRVSKLICTIFLGLFFIFGVITFILWLSLRPHRPRVRIHEFSITSLDQENGFENTLISFNITARNSNQNIGIYYDTMQVTVLYDDQSIGSTAPFSPFYQQPKNTTILAGTLGGPMLTVSNQRWMQLTADRSHGTVIFRVDLISTIRFKVSTWQSKRHRMHANCPVGVGSDGSILNTYKDKRCPLYFS